MTELKSTIIRQNAEIASLESILEAENEESRRSSSVPRAAGDSCETLYQDGEGVLGYYKVASGLAPGQGPQTRTVFCDFNQQLGFMTIPVEELVAFEAVRDASGDFAGNGVVRPYDKMNVDTRSGFFSLGSGVFTAPVDGTYRFFFEGLTMDSIADSYIHFRRNGNTVEEIQIDEGANHNTPFYSSIIIQLTTGDQIDVFLANGGIACQSNLYLFHFGGSWLF